MELEGKMVSAREAVHHNIEKVKEEEVVSGHSIKGRLIDWKGFFLTVELRVSTLRKRRLCEWPQY